MVTDLSALTGEADYGNKTEVERPASSTETSDHTVASRNSVGNKIIFRILTSQMKTQFLFHNYMMHTPIFPATRKLKKEMSLTLATVLEKMNINSAIFIYLSHHPQHHK